MALSHCETASLTLRLAAAVYFDADLIPAGDGAEAAALYCDATRGQLEGHAGAAGIQVKGQGEVAPYLLDGSQKLGALPPPPGDWCAGQLQGAQAFLCAAAQGMNNGPGDRIVLAQHDPGRCGVLDWVHQIGKDVLARLVRLECPCPSAMPQIEFVIATTADNQEFAPFLINGKTTISIVPRTVDIILLTGPLNSSALCHLAYTVHHELICHALQGINNPGLLGDAHESCHWSEAWMDAAAFDLLLDLVRSSAEKPSWLTLSGPDAEGALWEFHNHRYARHVSKLTDDDFRRRRSARQAYRELSKVMAAHNLASESEAVAISRCFSFIANMHPEANCKRLKLLGSKLMLVLLSNERPKAKVAAATACLAFTRDRRLAKLERELERAVSL